MISMMYLVYTALLALNVSVQILDGYKLVKESLDASIVVADESKATLEKALQKQVSENATRFAPIQKQYNELSEKANATIAYIENIKTAIIDGVDGANSDHKNLSDGGLGELNIPSVYWKQNIVKNNKESEDGKLYDEVKKFKDFAIEVALKNKIDTADINKTYAMAKKKTETGTRTWEARMFEDMPAIACLTMLTKTQNDIRNTQLQLGKEMVGNADKADVNFNTMEAVVIANSGYIMRGGKYEAKILLAAYDSTQKPDIYIGQTKLENGKYTVQCGSVGNKSYDGRIVVKTKNGDQEYKFKGEYTVGEPSATISPEMLNVVYAGYPNPMAVSCPGVPASDLSVTFSNCSMSKTNQGYTIVPRNPGATCEAVVSAKIDGRSQVMGKKSFRILPLPPPLAFVRIGNSNFGGGKIKKGAIGSAQEVVAELNSDLLKNVKYTVQGFDMKFVGAMDMKVLHSNTGRITDEQLRSIRSLTPNKTFYISGCMAKGPDGKIHKLPAVEIIVQ